MRARHLKLLCVLFAALAALMLTPSPAKAWGEDGHQTILRVAYDGLPSRLQRRFDAILRGADIRHQYDHLRRGRTVHEDCQADDIDELVMWADCVRYDESNPHFSAIRDYHFDDMPLCGTVPKRVYCPDGKCGTEALKRAVAALRNPSSTDHERLEALALVVHIVGDLHQPLHTITNGRPGRSDNGGNGVTVSVGGRDTNLHSFWDSGLLRMAYRSRSEAITATKAAARANEAAWGQNMDPEAWVRDGHEIAVAAYRRLARVPRCNARTANGGRISGDYERMFVPKVQEQLGMAAVRLRNLLRYALS